MDQVSDDELDPEALEEGDLDEELDEDLDEDLDDDLGELGGDALEESDDEEDEDDEDEDEEQGSAKESSDKVAARSADEFTCNTCFLIVHPRQFGRLGNLSCPEGYDPCPSIQKVEKMLKKARRS